MKQAAGPLVFIVDDEAPIRQSLARLFRSAGLESEGFASAEKFLERSTYDGASCIVLDVHMPNLDGLDLQRTLAERQAQIIFLTGHGDVPMCARAMKAGAVDFLTKPVDEEELLGATRRALAQSAEIRKSTGDRLAARERIGMLTPREFEVMRCVIAGRLNKQIANDLGAAEKTIKIHRGHVMRKMAVASVADLVRAAQMAGVTPVAMAT